VLALCATAAGPVIAKTAPTGGTAPAAAVVSNAPASPVDQTKVPHYFGPYPNWANSPLTQPDATVVITGDGTGAKAVATVGANGAVTDITVTDGGQGYTNAKVDITGAGTGASADATIVKKGAVVSVTVNTAGTGYTAPTVSFSGTGGAAATATGGVDAVNLSVQGEGYTFPTVDFDLPNDPNGVQATGHAVCVEVNCAPATSGATVTVTGILVDNAGSGYTVAPNVVVRDGTVFDPINPPSNFVPAKAAATLKVLSVFIDNPGSGYSSVPTVTINDPTGLGATATVALDNGVISAITVKKPGSGYVTGGGIQKFVDRLPGLGPTGANNLGQYIPVAQPDKTTFASVGTGADYYVIAVVQHRERMSSSLPAAGSLLREYVQLSTTNVPGKHVALVQDNLDGTTSAVMMPDGVTQAYGVDDPHYLGPTIVASKDRAVRVVFYDLLPKGVAGNLFLPTDTSLMGSGMGPTGMPAPVDEGLVTDGVRNPMCTDNPQDPSCFTQNRATLHLHGGVTPWISDGTPHQWITPANESTAWPQGVSVQNVPDMIGGAEPVGVPDCTAPTDGCQTFYYTNEQSARLMFYHDHAWGITRLNVYAGEAAGYVLTDPTEQKLFGPSGTYKDMGEGIPLIIQDKTFVPSPAQLAGQDPTWDASKWGGFGNLWYHHVYMPAQNPASANGMSAYGRWFYGPWFWPPATPVNGPIANPYFGKDPATNFATDLVVPCNLDNPVTWQYQVEPFCEPPTIPGTPNISVGMEQFNDTPLVNGTAYPTTTLQPKSYRFRILNAANDRAWNLSWYVADSTGTEVALKASELAAAQTDPNIVPTPDTALSPAGPNWIAIGSEGGFLPAPAVIPPQPTTYIIDPTRFDVGNVDKHSLVLAPAERSDVIVDFSKYAGQTLILYNDAPAAYPGRVATYDYYTGMPDLGAGVVLPGYGPNTRTVMQVKIAGTAAPAFNLTALNNVFKHHADGSGVFESSQDPIIVGQAAYNSAYGTTFASSGDCTNQTATNKCDGFARIAQQGGQTFRFDTLKGKQLKTLIEPKALHDEMNSAAFDEYGRMTSNLGLEQVPATPAAQNILLYPYIAPPTEVIDGTNLPKGDINIQAISSGADGTQIWKITHNGVDTHPIHFHLFNVQLLNRVTWDNIIIPPEASELGWKETIRVSPLEDTIVALRPIIPTVPFEIPNAIRPLSPMEPLGTNLDPQGLIVDPQGNVTTVTNALVNFGWEYVYHCHILSHEEMDMMRPMLLALPPLKPDTLAFDATTRTLTFNDNSITETSFVVQRSVDGTNWTDVGTIVSPLDQPNLHRVGLSVTDAVYDPLIGTSYRVVALNTVGSVGALLAAGYAGVTVQSISAVLLVGAPTTTTLTSDVHPSTFGQNVTFTATVSPALATGTVQFNIDGVNVGAPVALASGVATYATSTLAVGSHPVVATYNGVLPYGGSSGSLTQVVDQAPTTTTLTSSLNPSLLGQSVTFTATVSPATATGTVQFNVDGANVGAAVALAAGVATFATTTLAAGDHPVIATYGGDASFLGSTSSTLTQTVSPLAATTTALTSSLNPSTYGQSVTLTATVAPVVGVPVPTGTVQFNIDGSDAGAPVILSTTGVATFATTAMSAGSHLVVATYSGSSTYATSSGSLTQVVNKATTRTTVRSSDTNGRVGDTIRLTATTTVVAPGAGTRTGTVEFKLSAGAVTQILVAAAPIGTGGVTNFNWTLTAANVGTWTLTATYSGDTNFLTSSGTLANQRVR
jgi:FtsP/CotA-like multicopper oxidase with cupredoxin domain